MDHYQGKN